MFNFTPLLGARTESAASQSLLELDGGIKILVDVGWDEAFNAQRLDALSEHVSTLSLILLTHPTVEHIGAYAHCCKHIPLFAKIPVYATTPVINLGVTLLTDLYASAPLAASVIPSSTIATNNASPADASTNLLLEPPTADDIATYFHLINPLKYSQPHQPTASSWSPPLNSLTITAYGAGHTLGGTIWHIQHGMESIVYAADWNQGRENLLPGAAFLSGGQEILEPLQRPTALICSANGVERNETLARKDRDAALISLVRETIAQGGKVLIPTDSSARMLEIAFLLNEAWRDGLGGPHADTYRPARVYMASKTAKTTVRYLQSMLEWVEESVRAEAEAAMTKSKGQGALRDPMDWRHVRALERKGQVDQVLGRDKPCVLLTSDKSLEWGFARQGLKAMAGESRNMVVLTEEVRTIDPRRKGVGRQLWEAWRGGQSGKASGVKVVDGNGVPIEWAENSTTALAGDELALWETYQARQRQLHSTLQGDNTMIDPTSGDLADKQAAGEDEAADASSDSEDEDEDTEHQGRALNLSAQLTQSHKRQKAAEALTEGELGVNVLLRSQNAVHDYEVRGKKGREKMFPFVAKKSREDIFGIVIRAEDFLRAEEKDDVMGEDLKDDRSTVGGKRKWSEAAGGRGGKGAQQGKSKRARVEDGGRGKKGGGHDDIDAAIARATGEGDKEDGEDDFDSESDYEPEDFGAAGPQKVVSTTQELQLHLRIAHIDFAGLCGMRALQMIVPLVRPKKVILTSGSESEVQALAEALRPGMADGTEILTPKDGEIVEAGGDSNAWSLKLSRQLVKRLTWQNVKGLGVVALTGRLGVDPTTTQSSAVDVKAETKEEDDTPKKKKARLVKEEAEPEQATKSSAKPDDAHTALPILDLPSSSSALASIQHTQPTRPVHVGDLRLASLRELLTSSGHTAVFAGEGTLLVNNVVIVRKAGGGNGRIEIECAVRGLDVAGRSPGGGMGDGGTFGAVKRAVYGGLAVVAGV
ncbi:hypothetical protein LTR78_007956 [Recurvomyces mirabilis]|uniref:Cleavage and polyadenylation specificity factor subunit 2 n=1 Tax=Recurvomyces mirabilis TaxID=574656 RepID=A0AAE0TR18_9PEZI|nr:hypothetical protein LTR78_007956 [Recurvomyces mirabilis]KAK5152492.1 hypothetical protein LTS14_008439 [Recurvomyces mirabilis]